VSTTKPADRRRHQPERPPSHAVEIKADLELERETLDESIRHDYSTSSTGIVPLDHRRPMWHFASLWLTLFSGFSLLFLGLELYRDGQSLGETTVIVCLGGGIYLIYAVFSAYLGSRTGQTHALLTRSIFGVAGSWLVSSFVFIAPLGWVAFQANLLVTVWDGLYGWGNLLVLTVVMSGAMVFNSLFGFTGIAVYARYLVTPLIVLWVLYLVLKVALTDAGELGGAPPDTLVGGGFWTLVGLVIGVCAWGNEPDTFRYGKPRFWWSLSAYAFGLTFGLLLFTIGGWMMARLADTTDFGQLVRFTTEYSLFGAFWLAWILATVSQIALNDGNYYESINGGQNLLGGWRKWKRAYSCLVAAGLGAFAGWWVNFHVLDGFFYVANFLAITVPCATVIMVVDHFLLPRLFGISRSLTRVPAWNEAGRINLPAFIACVGAIAYGAYATHLFAFLGESSTRYWGPAPLEAWLLAGALYIVGVAICRAVAPADVKKLLGFDSYWIVRDLPPDAVVDIASVSGAAPRAPVAATARARSVS
jgi:cytosine permease